MTPTADISVISPEGALGLTTSPALRESLIAACADHPVVVLDFSKVTATDSTTLGVLVGAAKRCRQSGTRLLVHNADGGVRRALTITGLMRELDDEDVPEQLREESGLLQPA